MSDLTFEKLAATMRELEKIAPRRDPGLFDYLRPRPLGMDLYEAPPPPPKIQVADITFDDGTPILEPAFRAEMNAWLAGRFGYRDDPFKDKIYFLGNYGMIASPMNCAIIRNLGA